MIAFLAIAVIATPVILGVFGCGQKSSIPTASKPPTETQYRPVQQVPLSTDPALKVAVEQSDAFRQLSPQFGSPNLADAVITTYTNTSIRAVIIPCQKGGGLLLYSDPDRAQLGGFMLQMNLSRAETGEGALNGTVSVLDAVSGQVMTSATYKNSTVVDQMVASLPDRSAQRSSLEGTAWLCWSPRRFATCLAGVWPEIPWWLKWACGVYCTACILSPAQPELFPACLPCYGCVGGRLIGCWTRAYYSC
ncbi:MAG: hypothetical protein V1907_01180 [Candidatus Kerfeldbacteria bacterium]